MSQGKNANYRNTARQYRYTAGQKGQLSQYRKAVSLFRRAIIAIPQFGDLNYRYIPVPKI